MVQQKRQDFWLVVSSFQKRLDSESVGWSPFILCSRPHVRLWETIYCKRLLNWVEARIWQEICEEQVLEALSSAIYFFFQASSLFSTSTIAKGVSFTWCGWISCPQNNHFILSTHFSLGDLLLHFWYANLVEVWKAFYQRGEEGNIQHSFTLGFVQRNLRYYGFCQQHKSWEQAEEQEKARFWSTFCAEHELVRLHLCYPYSQFQTWNSLLRPGKVGDGLDLLVFFATGSLCTIAMHRNHIDISMISMSIIDDDGDVHYLLYQFNQWKAENGGISGNGRISTILNSLLIG